MSKLAVRLLAFFTAASSTHGHARKNDRGAMIHATEDIVRVNLSGVLAQLLLAFTPVHGGSTMARTTLPIMTQRGRIFTPESGKKQYRTDPRRIECEAHSDTHRKKGRPTRNIHSWTRREGDTAEVDVTRVENKQYRTDPRRIERDAPSDTHRKKGRPTRNIHSWTRREGDTAEVDVTRVESLLEKRADSKIEGDFNLADEIRRELETEMRVRVDDKSHLWWVSPGVWSSTGEYKRAQGDNAPVDVAHVEFLMQQRLEARKNRNFVVADAILEKLRTQLNVRVEDDSRVWRVDCGDRSSGPRWERYGKDSTRHQLRNDVHSNQRIGRRSASHDGNGRDKAGGSGYMRTGDDTRVDVMSIEKLLAARLRARRDHNFQKADAMRAQLFSQYRVDVNDKASTWWVVS